jgi:uncharacterized protein DUF2154/cell wall-active antibiotic response 4TMS protein YvqF
VVLICVGIFFLLANVLPGFHPWWFFSRYWPALLIVAGLGRVWDYYSAQRGGDAGSETRNEAAVGIVLIALVVLLVLGVWHFDRRPESYNRSETRSVDLQNATSVAAKLEMAAGTLDIRGGSDKLLDADIQYDSGRQQPEINYSVTGTQGQLDVSERGGNRDVHFGSTDSEWKLRFNQTVPLDLNLEMGAGQSELRLGQLNLTHLEINIGAGQMNLDLTGPRKQNLVADVEGGAGQATIRLPKDVGVRVHAEGGLGAIDTHGLTKQGDEYVNAAYGKAPVLIDLTVEGGVGEIDLREEN